MSTVCGSAGGPAGRGRGSERIASTAASNTVGLAGLERRERASQRPAPAPRPRCALSRAAARAAGPARVPIADSGRRTDIRIRHQDVDEHQVGIFVPDDPQRVVPVASLEYAVPMIPEQRHDKVAIDGSFLNDEYRSHVVRSTFRVAWRQLQSPSRSPDNGLALPLYYAKPHAFCSQHAASHGGYIRRLDCGMRHPDHFESLVVHETGTRAITAGTGPRKANGPAARTRAAGTPQSSARYIDPPYYDNDVTSRHGATRQGRWAAPHPIVKSHPIRRRSCRVRGS